jgi:hypothetical protein
LLIAAGAIRTFAVERPADGVVEQDRVRRF